MADEAGYLLSEFDANWVIANAGQKMDEQRETVRRMGPQCVIAKNGASAIAARSGSTLSSQSCTVYSGTAGSLTSLSRTITVYNLNTDDIPADAYLVAALVGNIWVAVQPPSITLTVVTDVQVSGTTLQYKTRSVTVLAAGTESAWTTWHTGTTC